MAEIDVQDSGDGFNAVLKVSVGLVDIPLPLSEERALLGLLIARAKARGEHLTV